MKRILAVSVLFLLNFVFYFPVTNGNTEEPETWTKPQRIDGEIFNNWDIIFQSSQSGQSQAIQLATHSKYSHCGLIFWDSGKCYVLEAGREVTATPLEDFIKRGTGRHYVVKRLKQGDTTFNSVQLAQKMSKLYSGKFAGKPYDLYFGWSDDKIYCSELVWKMYKEGAGIEVGQVQELKEFDLSNEIVKKIMKERYGDKVPLEEQVISPAAIFDSEKLKTVFEN